jgi:adenine phosphoribosyltransferase
MTTAETRARMAELYVPVTDRGTRSEYINLQPWWRDPLVVSGVGELLARPFVDHPPTVVIGPPASGHLLGALVAGFFGVGFAAVRKDPERAVDSDPWLISTTPPDYQDRHLEFGLRQGILRPSDRVLAVDDIVDTGSQLLAIRQLVQLSGSHWSGASVALDLLTDHRVRRDLALQSVFRERDL